MKKNIEITLVEAKKLYPKSTPEWKDILENNFGKKHFSTDITERITCLDDILAEAGKDAQWIENLKKTHSPRAVHFEIMEVIQEVLNEGWEADWDNGDQAKEVVIFTGGRSGFRFLDSYSYYDYTNANLGSCFPFANKKIAEFAVKLFLSQFKGIIIK
jgi:hypothetical protein